jgi:hypothetical protein
MIIDYQDELSHDATNDVSAQSLIGDADTAINGAKVKDGGAAGDWAAGCEVKGYIRIGTAVVGCTGGVKFDLVASANADLSAGTVLSTKTIATASLTANSLHYFPPPAPGTRKRYLGVIATPATTACTAGTFVFGLVPCGATPQNRVNSL